ncbi:MAG: hypothetical protein K0S23_2563 [Fluviicola sp.]|uniref:T9SS type A sorting domain-containing protein n=1 Tax=Fluviicola sp. TaxID=1917219 RepID=UPI00260CE5BC|nr:T9SS type A sorting domain-containing protein [Fluviicola sp.]MDF3028256.1 hypothetical protein [Fluviicola sp.]
MKTIITSILILGMSGAFGQGALTLTTSNSNARFSVSNNGMFFSNPSTTGGYFVPKDSLVSSIYSTAFMAVGRDINGGIKGAVAKIMNSDFTPGPYLPNQANYSSQSYINKYQFSLWDITKAQIDHHIAHWADQGYVVPGIINFWPGNGDTGNGESLLLAPFHDSDGDQVYEPEYGEYPIIRGDKAVYTIINDGNGVHSSGLDRAQLEVHMMFYQYDDSTDGALTNTVFFQTTVFNRGTQSLTDFHAGHFIDFDLGNPHDDYIGTEPGRNLAYIYNGDLNDEFFSGNPGYGEMPPAAGILNLDGSLYSHILISDPSGLNTASEYYNVLSGLLPDGSQLLDANNQPTTYIYNDLDSLTGWHEYMLGNPSGDRRSVSGHDPVNFGPGEVLCYNNAAIFARKFELNLTASVDSLFLVANHIQDFYNNQNFYCETQHLGLQEEQQLSISIYPNPAKDQIRVDGLTFGTYRIVNLEGKELLAGTLENPFIQIDLLKNGFYILEITSGRKYDRKSFVKE